METNLIKAACGDCGNKTFEVYRAENNHNIIITECTKCKSSSAITVSTPKLEINFHNNSTGLMYFSREN